MKKGMHGGIPKLKLLALLNLLSSSSFVTLENFLHTKLLINLIRVVSAKVNKISHKCWIYALEAIIKCVIIYIQVHN